MTRITPASSRPTPRSGPSNRPVHPKHRRQERLDGDPEERGQHDEAPQAVDDARHRGQQLDRGRQDGPDPAGTR